MFGEEYNIVREFPKFFLNYRKCLTLQYVGQTVFSQVLVIGLEIFSISFLK